MNTVWKWKINTKDDQNIEAPDNAQPLSVQVQHEEVCLWMLVDPNIPTRTYHVKIVGTGHPFQFDDEYKFVGTYHLVDGYFVGHVFVA